MEHTHIRVVGAKEHNLKNISVDIPRNQFVVITGLSGSGKSSLAFDTIFAEGQRRYVESLSSYARQFLGQKDKPNVEYIEGLSPAVSIDQKGSSHNPRSTVGTVTEIYDYLRLLFARIGVPHCPICGREVVRQSAQEIVEAVEQLPEDTRVLLLAPLVRGRKGEHSAVLEEIAKAGFVRARVNGDVVNLDEDEVKLDRYKNHTIEAVVDRLVIHHPEDAGEQDSFRSRLTDSIETALQFGDGLLVAHNLSADPPEDLLFSEQLTCPEHGSVLPEIEPRTFSFNTPHGACPECQGIGTKLEVDPDLLIPNKNLSFNQGAIHTSEWGGPREEGGYYWSTLEGAAKKHRISLDKPVKDLKEKDIDVILYGTNGNEVEVKYTRKSGRTSTFHTAFEGVVTNLERRFRETSSEYMRSRIMEYMNDRACPACGGARLRKEALGVTIGEVNILDVTTWPVQQTLDWCASWKPKAAA